MPDFRNRISTAGLRGFPGKPIIGEAIPDKYKGKRNNAPVNVAPPPEPIRYGDLPQSRPAEPQWISRYDAY